MQPAAKSWRLKKTLARNLDFRPIEAEDVKYAWLIYKKGGLASMGEKFADAKMDAAEFKATFESEIVENYHAAWTLFADTNKGYLPVGFVLGFWSHPNPKLAPFMIIGGILWLPWASPRNKIEAAVHFFNTIRNEIKIVEYARQENKKFFETIARHGVMRRVGTSHNVYGGEPAAVFETRSP